MYIRVNGIDLWYSVRGSGMPIVLLHGMMGSSEIFQPLAEKLSDDFTVYSLDSRNHGESGSSKEYSYELMADDAASFIKELKLAKPALFGFSDGGIVGLMLASKCPDLLSSLIVSGVNTSPKGLKRIWRMLYEAAYFFTRDIRIRICLDGPRSQISLGKISVPVLVLAGSRDSIREEETRRIAGSIPGSALVTMDHETHGSYVIKSPKLSGLIKSFTMRRQKDPLL
jgi:pimeloyl-ACP methyl ester carboxylesterase